MLLVLTALLDAYNLDGTFRVDALGLGCLTWLLLSPCSLPRFTDYLLISDGICGKGGPPPIFTNSVQDGKVFGGLWKKSGRLELMLPAFSYGLNSVGPLPVRVP